MKAIHLTSFIFAASLFAACTHNVDSPIEWVPKQPDYADNALWITHLNDSANRNADIFYIPSTWEFDWNTPHNIPCHYADTYCQKHRRNMATEMNAVAEYMAVDNNFYSPYYRHISLNTWATLNEDTINRRYRSVSLPDVQRAFDYYIRHFNQGRPFILAGFSQGAKSVVELIKSMPADVYSRMVAAYVLGYKVTPDDVQAAPWIKPAADSADVGVTICYNSVSDVKYTKPIVSTPNVMCINPVNWRTDATPATLNDTITVTLNPEHKVLVLNGFDGSSLPNILDVLNVGDYHGIEPWLYSDCLKHNIRLRIAAHRSQTLSQ